ncbi:MAG: cobamide remodeling phosphodiesterase CbiR [Chloroflexota bacterium]
MRFGIMSAQLNLLIPAGLPAEELLTHIAKISHAGLIRELAGRGFDPIELNGDLAMLLPHLYAPPVIEQLAALEAEIGVCYTVHLPLWSIETSTPQAAVRKGSVQAVIDSIRATQPLEPEAYVLHATGALAAEFYRMNLPDLVKSFLLGQFQNGARESIQTILAETGIPSRKIAIETIEFPFEMTQALADELDLSICFDTGHVLVGFSGPVDFFDALEQCLPRISDIHLHDGPWQDPEQNIGYGKDHQALGKGDLDVVRLLDRLSEANYTGPVIFELTVEEALDSLEVIRAVRPELLSERVSQRIGTH